MKATYMFICGKCDLASATFHAICNDGEGAVVRTGMRLAWGTYRGMPGGPHETEVCHVCEGAGQLSYQKPGGCQCCNGTGWISSDRAASLKMIRRDLAARLGNETRECQTCSGGGSIRDRDTNRLRKCLDCNGNGSA